MADPGPFSSLVSTILDSEPHTYTHNHYRLILQALRTKNYAAAIPVLDSDIYSLSTPATHQDGPDPNKNVATEGPILSDPQRYQELLSYFLFGGMIYLGVGNYDRAISFFELATIYPTSNTASKIQIEAYKKWILVNLLHNGKVPSLIRTLSGQQGRITLALTKPYEALAEVFVRNDFQALAETVDAGREIWEQDMNIGLISLVLRAHQRVAISSLSKIYTSIPISKVHSLIFPPTTTHDEVYDYLANLISSGLLSATLTQSSSNADSSSVFLRFAETSAEGIEVESQRKHQARLQQSKIELLNDHVKDLTHTLQLTRPYLEMLQKSKKQAANGEDGRNGFPKAPGAYIEDEDEYLESL